MGITVLEVTAGNTAAVELYQSIGFRTIQVLYRDTSTGETVTEVELAITDQQMASLFLGR